MICGCFKNLKLWMKNGIIGFFIGIILYILRTFEIVIPYFSDWSAEAVSLSTVGITMVVVYTIAGIFIGELITLSTKRKK